MAGSKSKTLRVVKPGEKPAPRKKKPAPKSITEAAAGGTDRELLVALQARIAATVEDPNCPPRDLAALTRRLQDITKDIAAIDARIEKDGQLGVDTPDEEWSVS